MKTTKENCHKNNVNNEAKPTFMRALPMKMKFSYVVKRLFSCEPKGYRQTTRQMQG